MALSSWRAQSNGLDIPLTLLSTYLFFLLRRPVSSSNLHYLSRRLRGLQSLAAMLDTESRYNLGTLVQMLRRLTPANFSRMAPPLQLQLASAQRALLNSPSLFVSHQPPPRWPFPSARRLLIILGPGIGIGDEIILFPLPAAIHAIYPDVEIVVLSGYRGLWDRVRGVDHPEYYETHAELVDAIRGASLGNFDAVLFADFEKPGLTPAFCSNAPVRTYIELSLGAQSAVFVDTRLGHAYASTLPMEARANYYEAAEWLLEWLGIPIDSTQRYADLIERSPRDDAGPFRIFVSPFTSKYEPSLQYWSRILGSLNRLSCSRGLEFVLDAGASLATERFAAALIGASRSLHGAPVRFRIAADRDSRTLSLSGVLGEMERCEAVICADSFAAHAGPVFGCATLVVARAGLESWRTPSSRSFYFDSEQPLDQVQSAMAAILQVIAQPGGEAQLPSPAVDLHLATCRLQGALTNAMILNASALSGEYGDFRVAFDNVARNPQGSAACPPGLLADSSYQRRWLEIDAEELAGRREETIRRLRVEVARWENTNLRKFLGLAYG
jgi:hypothetical protein